MAVVIFVLLGAVFAYAAALVGISWPYTVLTVAGGILSWWFDKLDRRHAGKFDPGLAPRWSVWGVLSGLSVIALPTFGAFWVDPDLTWLRLGQGVAVGMFAKGVAVYTELAVGRRSRKLPPA